MPEKNIATPSNLYVLATDIFDKNIRLAKANKEEIPACVHSYKDLLLPWHDYLHEMMPQQVEYALTCVNLIGSYDCTRRQLAEAMSVVADNLKQIANTLATEQCTTAIQEAFSFITTPTDAVALATKIDCTKNACLEAQFSK